MQGHKRAINLVAESLALANLILSYKPLITPSTFLLDLKGQPARPMAPDELAAARHCGIDDARIQSAFDAFQGVARRMEVRGEARGVAVVDDFGHHPTAIRETLKALRIKYPTQKLWAVFEPRSNTTRRNVFQTDLVDALERADVIVVAEVARLEQLRPEERLNPEKLMQDLRRTGKPAAYLPTVDAIVDHLATQTRPGDVVCCFSNGGFGGIHARVLSRLGEGRK